jgi:hypothetical protein
MADRLLVIAPPRLIIKAVNSNVPGKRAIALCTEDGEIVGRQYACAVSSEVGSLGTITVSFHIDGDCIRFADNDG